MTMFSSKKNYKNELQELLQGRHSELPVYVTEGFAERWTCTVTVRWSNGEHLMERAEVIGKKKEAEQEAAKKMLLLIRTKGGAGREVSPKIIWAGYGDGKSKKEAETRAAQSGLDYMQNVDFGSQSLLTTITKKSSPPREFIDPDTEEGIHEALACYSVEFLHEQGEEGTCLCMARTTVCTTVSGSGLTIASHGQGGSPAAAERDASLHLIQNINHLTTQCH